jgi:hypothetical protein
LSQQSGRTCENHCRRATLVIGESLISWHENQCFECLLKHTYKQVLREIQRMLDEFAPPSPTQAFELLLPSFPAANVRTYAVGCIFSQWDDDQVLVFLPQVHAPEINQLKFLTI